MARANFGSKLGAVLVTAGSAVGLGNIWRFPYMAGENGGAIFILIYFVCVIFLGIPCMVSEFVIGRYARANTVGAFKKLGGKSLGRYIGYLHILSSFLIASYYAVVSGWCLQYLYATIKGDLGGNLLSCQSYFNDFVDSPYKGVIWTVVIFLLSYYVVCTGVKGIEKASKLMMPALFFLLIFLVGIFCFLPNASKGIAFLFELDFSELNGDVILGALGQSFFSLSLGVGCLCTYASYFSKETKLGSTAVQIGVIDSFVAILAGMMIFPAAFSVGVQPDAGPSLIFVTLPGVFNEAFASIPWLGVVVSLAFYFLLSLAAITSLISLHEVCLSFLHEEFDVSTKSAATIVTACCVAIGSLCSLSLSDLNWLEIAGESLFDWFDFVTGQVLIPLGGLLSCLFIGWGLPPKIFKDEYTNYGTTSGKFFAFIFFCIKYICPLCIITIFFDQFGLI